MKHVLCLKTGKYPVIGSIHCFWSAVLEEKLYHFWMQDISSAMHRRPPLHEYGHSYIPMTSGSSPVACQKCTQVHVRHILEMRCWKERDMG